MGNVFADYGTDWNLIKINCVVLLAGFLVNNFKHYIQDLYFANYINFFLSINNIIEK